MIMVIVSPMNRGALFLIATILVLLAAIRRNPKDRVLVCQTLAFVSTIAAAFIISWADLSGSAVILALIPFITFTFLAGYVGLMNWVRRRKRVS